VEALRVCTDVDEALSALRAGAAVVLLGTDATALGRAARCLRSQPGGRVAVFVGDPSDAAVRAAAVDLAEEQFARIESRSEDPPTPAEGLPEDRPARSE
jgi:hypothetical protein